MSKVYFILRVLSFLLLFFVLLYIIRILRSFFHNKRLEKFAITEKDKVLSVQKIWYLFVKKVSSKLEKVKYFRRVCKKYNKYVINDSIYNIYDFLTIKCFLALFCVFIYIIISLLIKTAFSYFILIILLFAGFYIPNLYFMIKNKNRYDSLKILNIVIILKNKIKDKKDIEEALVDIIKISSGYYKKEYKKTLDDIKLGLKIDEAFMRMYNDCKINEIRDLANIFYLARKTNLDVVKALEDLERDIVNKVNLKNISTKINELSNILFAFLAFVPIIIVIIECFCFDFLNNFNQKSIMFLVFIYLLVLYILYIYLLIIIAKRVNQND